MKVTNLNARLPQVGDIILLHPVDYSTKPLTRIIVSWDGDSIVLLDPADCEITTSVFESFEEMYYDCIKEFFTYTIIDKSKLELIIHS